MSKRVNSSRMVQIRKDEGLKIDPATAEVTWGFVQKLDPYGISQPVRRAYRRISHAMGKPEIRSQRLRTGMCQRMGARRVR
jgi:hypothetical protein